MQDEEKARKERMKDYRRRYREKHGIKDHSYRWQKVVGAIVGICLIGAGSFLAAQHRAEAMVTLQGQSIEGWTADDVSAYVRNHEKDIQGKRIAVTGEGIDETIELDSLDVAFDIDSIEDELYLVGRKGSPIERISDVVTTLRFGKDVPLSLRVDDEKLNKKIKAICEAYDVAPKDAYITPNGDNKNVTIHKETERIVIDGEALTKQVQTQLRDGVVADIEAPVAERTAAKVKEADLTAIDTVLSYYTTHFDDSNKDRNSNITLAQEKLNHVLVPSKTDFSFNKHIGARTHENGYKDAPVYFDNKLVPDAGGGVCQVSTTLFNAVLRAGLFIASRAPHFAPAAYVPVGMDATVADDSLDFAFTNPFSHAVYIYTVATGNTITTYILGNHEDACTVTFKTTGLENLPHQVIHKHDTAVTEDKRDQEGYDGHDITIQRTVVYADGDHYTDTIVSHYAPNAEIILTPGDGAEEVVKTSDLEPQDTLLNAPHDMWEAVAAPAEEYAGEYDYSDDGYDEYAAYDDGYFDE